MSTGFHWSKVLQIAGAVVLFAASIASFLMLQKQREKEYLHVFGPAFVDGDCYARMTRARLILDGQAGPVIRHHEFENFPEGTRPHTTAPLDWILVIGAKALGGGQGALDRAGFALPVILGVIFLAGVRVLLGILGARWAGAAVFLLAVSPVIAHAFSPGRPDHQSLVLLLCGWALLVEILWWRASGKSRAASLVLGAGIGLLWGFALWVSWFEPLVLLGFVILARLISRRVRARRQMLSLVVTAGMAGLVVLVEGIPGTGLDPSLRPAFFRWAEKIGELQHGLPWAVLPGWVGWFAMAVPFAFAYLLLRRRREFARSAHFVEGGYWLGLAVLTVVLTAWHARWGYFAAFSLALLIPWFARGLRPAWMVVLLFVAGLWPVASEWERILYPPASELRDRVHNATETRDLYLIANALSRMPGDAVLAPWWLTPALVYWSGKNGVAGTSHQSLPGILDSARFFAETDPARALEILRARGVRYVLAADSAAVLENSLAVLGPDAPQTGGNSTAEAVPMAVVLHRKTTLAPPGLRLVFQTQTLKLYEFHETGAF